MVIESKWSFWDLFSGFFLLWKINGLAVSFRAQQKPPTPAPVVQPRTPVQTSDANSQVMGKEIFEASRAKDSGTQLSAEDWRKMQIQEKNRNYVYGLGHFPPFAVDNWTWREKNPRLDGIILF